MKPDDNVSMQPTFPYHPYKGSKKKFNREAGKLLKAFAGKYSHKSYEKNLLELLTNESESKNLNDRDKLNMTKKLDYKDTLVFPLLQMFTFGIRQDEHVTRNILATAPKTTNLLLATAYFNLTDDYWKAILNTKPKVDIIMAHPKAMGFYKAAGMAGK